MRLDTYLYKDDIAQDAMTLLEMGIFFEEYGKLDEGILDKFKDIKGKAQGVFKKMGLHTSKSPGLIEYLIGSGKNIGKLIYYGMLYSTGSAQEKEKAAMSIKEISKTVTKEKVLDFLYKLDQLTLHTVTGPLHALDSITGWHIAADIKKKVEPAITKAKKAIEWLESTKEELEGKLKAQLQKYVNAIRRVFNLGDFQKVKA